jgi:hypothetical protein
MTADDINFAIEANRRNARLLTPSKPGRSRDLIENGSARSVSLPGIFSLKAVLFDNRGCGPAVRVRDRRWRLLKSARGQAPSERVSTISVTASAAARRTEHRLISPMMSYGMRLRSPKRQRRK